MKLIPSIHSLIPRWHVGMCSHDLLQIYSVVCHCDTSQALKMFVDSLFPLDSHHLIVSLPNCPEDRSWSFLLHLQVQNTPVTADISQKGQLKQPLWCLEPGRVFSRKVWPSGRRFGNHTQTLCLYFATSRYPNVMEHDRPNLRTLSRNWQSLSVSEDIKLKCSWKKSEKTSFSWTFTIPNIRGYSYIQSLVLWFW